MQKTFEQYLASAHAAGQIDHHLRVTVYGTGKLSLYVHPAVGNGETLDFVVRGNALAPNVTKASDVDAAGAEIRKHPSHPDVPRPSDDELLLLAVGVCQAIDACGASPELTHAVTLASDLCWYLEKPQHAGDSEGSEGCANVLGSGLSFGQAIELMKSGHRVARSGWNGKGMWIAYTPGSQFAPEHAKPGHAAAFRAIEAPNETVRLLPHIDMRAADGSMVIGWLASQADMLAEDWHVVGVFQSTVDHCEHAANALAAADAPVQPLLDEVIHA